MICLSLGNIDFSDALKAIEEIELVELRLDLLNFSNDEYKYLFSLTNKFISTYAKNQQSDDYRFHKLLKSIEYGSDYIDIDFNLDPNLRNKLFEAAEEKQVKTICSIHYYNECPDFEKLKSILFSIENLSADISKIIVNFQNETDLKIIDKLFGINKKPLIAYSLGSLGYISRVEAIKRSPVVFASLDNNLQTADGQITYKEMKIIEIAQQGTK